jgi:hypothetical protein
MDGMNLGGVWSSRCIYARLKTLTVENVGMDRHAEAYEDYTLDPGSVEDLLSIEEVT